MWLPMQRSKKRCVEFLVSKLLLINSRPGDSVQMLIILEEVNQRSLWALYIFPVEGLMSACSHLFSPEKRSTRLPLWTDKF